MRAFKLVQSAAFSFLISALLVNPLGTTAANANQSLSASFAHMCIWVFDLAEDLHFETRIDLAKRVSSAVRAMVEADERNRPRKVWAAPDCIKVNQSGFDRQLSLNLSVKRQKIKLDGRDWNVLIASGVSTDGLIQDREVQPVIVVQQESISDDSIVSALVAFVDRTVVATLRR